VEFGVVLADAGPVSSSGRAGVAAELGQLRDESLLRGFAAGQSPAEFGGLGVAADGFVGRAFGQEPGQHGGPVMAEHELVQK
jgi:hypothetical protein